MSPISEVDLLNVANQLCFSTFFFPTPADELIDLVCLRFRSSAPFLTIKLLLIIDFLVLQTKSKILLHKLCSAIL